MGYIKFKNKETVQKVIVSEESPHVIRITGDNLVVNTDGFSLYLDEDCKYPLDNGEYEAYNTLFREGDGWYELSDDGSVYVEPGCTGATGAHRGRTGRNGQTGTNPTGNSTDQ